MKLCRYCNSEMMEEYETNQQNSHRYKGFFTCTNCHAFCDGEYLDSKLGTQTLRERWWNPETNKFEERR